MGVRVGRVVFPEKSPLVWHGGRPKVNQRSGHHRLKPQVQESLTIQRTEERSVIEAQWFYGGRPDQGTANLNLKQGNVAPMWNNRKQ